MNDTARWILSARVYPELCSYRYIVQIYVYAYVHVHVYMLQLCYVHTMYCHLFIKILRVCTAI